MAGEAGELSRDVGVEGQQQPPLEDPVVSVLGELVQENVVPQYQLFLAHLCAARPGPMPRTEKP